MIVFDLEGSGLRWEWVESVDRSVIRPSDDLLKDVRIWREICCLLLEKYVRSSSHTLRHSFYHVYQFLAWENIRANALSLFSLTLCFFALDHTSSTRGCLLFIRMIILVFRRFRKIATKKKRLLASSCLFVRPSIRPHEATRLPLDGFSWNFIFEYFSKLYGENACFIKIWQK